MSRIAVHNHRWPLIRQPDSFLSSMMYSMEMSWYQRSLYLNCSLSSKLMMSLLRISHYLHKYNPNGSEYWATHLNYRKMYGNIPRSCCWRYKIKSKASSALCRRVSSDASIMSNCGAGSSNSIPVIFCAFVGCNENTFGYKRSPSCCEWCDKCSFKLTFDDDDELPLLLSVFRRIS